MWSFQRLKNLIGSVVNEILRDKQTNKSNLKQTRRIQTFQPIIWINKRGNFVYHNRGQCRVEGSFNNPLVIEIGKTLALPYTLHSFWPTNEIYISNLNWRQLFPCPNIHVYYIHISKFLILSYLLYTNGKCSTHIHIINITIFGSIVAEYPKIPQ